MNGGEDEGVRIRRPLRDNTEASVYVERLVPRGRIELPTP